MRRIDPRSPEWLLIKAHLRSERTRCHEEMESLDCADKRTDQLRGYIECIKDVLALADPPPERVATENYD